MLDSIKWMATAAEMADWLEKHVKLRRKASPL
jgi:hypothetical protein